MLNKRILWLTLTAFISMSSHAQNNNKVVVIPMAGDSTLQGTTVTIVGSNIVTAHAHACHVVSCPESHPLAIGGGVDPENVFYMRVTSSGPTINNNRTLSTANGTYNDSSDGWYGCVLNNMTSTKSFKIATICSK